MQELLKDFYYGMEEKWYKLMDGIDSKGIPVYKIIDPIDKIIPSFILFILIILALIVIVLVSVFGLGLPLLTPAGQEAVITVKVIDSGTSSALTSVTVKVIYMDDTTDFKTTNSNGEITGLNALTGDTITFEVQQAGYKAFSESFDIVNATETFTLRLIPDDVVFGPSKTITLIDNTTGQQLNVPAQIDFSCSTGSVAPASMIVYDGTVSYSEPNNCGTLSISISATGYSTVYSYPISDGDLIYLTQLDYTDDYGTIYVDVIYNNQPVNASIKLTLYTAGELGPIDSITVADGVGVFSNVPAGDYVVRAFDPLNEYGPAEKNVTLVAGGTASVTIDLSQDIAGWVKVKIVSSKDQSIIYDASVILKEGESELATQSTSITNEGIVTFSVLNLTGNYRIIASHPDYLLQSLVVTPTANQDDLPLLMQLDHYVPGVNAGELKVKVVNALNEPVERAIIKLYDEDTGFLADYPQQVTDLNGETIFKGIVSGNYSAFAMKGIFSGRSDTVYFNHRSEEETVINVVMNIPQGIVRVKVTDPENEPVPFTELTFTEVTGLGDIVYGPYLTDGNGLFDLSLDAGNQVFVKAEKEGFSDFVSLPVTVAGNTVKTIDVNLQYPLVSGIVKATFNGLYKDDELVKGNIVPGQEYDAKFYLQIPETKDYDKVGLHLRVGTYNLMENDFIYFKEITALNADRQEVKQYTRYTKENEGSEPTQKELDNDLASLTKGDFKWVNTAWNNPANGTFEVSAKIKIKDQATFGTALPIYYRAWGIKGSTRDREPTDNLTINGFELYDETYSEVKEVGFETLCSDEFCFNSTILDLEENLRENVSETYNAKTFSNYTWNFTITNNSLESVHDNSEIRIINTDQGTRFTDYTIVNADGEQITGSPLPQDRIPAKGETIDLGNYSAGKSINGTVNFSTSDRSGTKIIRVLIVSDQMIVFEKEIIIEVESTNNLSLTVEPTTLTTGINNVLYIKVVDTAENLGLNDVDLKVLDNYDTVLYSSDTNVTGETHLTIPAPGYSPGTSLTVKAEKPQYNTAEVIINFDDTIAKLSPEQLGLTLNPTTQPQDTTSFTITNLTAFDLTLSKVSVSGDFQNLISKERMEEYLQSSFEGKLIPANEVENFSWQAALTEEGKLIEQTTDLTGKINLTLTGLTGTWNLELPLRMTIGLGGEVDEQDCLSASISAWEATTEGKEVSTSFTIQNNCVINSNPIDLVGGMEAKVNWNSNNVGEFALSIDGRKTILRPGYFKKVIDLAEAEQTYTAIISFTPTGRIVGDATASIELKGINITNTGEQELTHAIESIIHIVSLDECIDLSKKEIEMLEHEKDSFTVNTFECGGLTNFKIECSDCAGLTIVDEEFSVPANSSSDTITVNAGDAIPGRYQAVLTAKSFNDRSYKKVGEIGIIINPIGCLKLNRYEFEVFNDSDLRLRETITYPFDPKTLEGDLSETIKTGFDTTDIVNNCPTKPHTVKITKKTANRFWDAVTTGLLASAGTGIISLLTSGKDKEDETKTQSDEEPGADTGDKGNGDNKPDEKSDGTSGDKGNGDGSDSDNGGDNTNEDSTVKEEDPESITLLTGFSDPVTVTISISQAYEKACAGQDITPENVNEFVNYVTGNDVEGHPRTMIWNNGEWKPLISVRPNVVKGMQPGDKLQFKCKLPRFSSAENYSTPTGFSTWSSLFSGLSLGSSKSLGGGIMGLAKDIVGTVLGSNPWVTVIGGGLIAGVTKYMTTGDKSETLKFDDFTDINLEELNDAGEDSTVRLTDETTTLEEFPPPEETNLQIPDRGGITTVLARETFEQTMPGIQMTPETRGIAYLNKGTISDSHEPVEDTVFRTFIVNSKQHKYLETLTQKVQTGLQDFFGFINWEGITESKYNEKIKDLEKTLDDGTNDYRQKFHLQFNAGLEEDQNQGLIDQGIDCLSDAGEIGKTGANALPKVKFAWKWTDKEIGFDSCTDNEEGFYCDAVQFSMMALTRLHYLDEFLKNYGSQLVCPQDFASGEAVSQSIPQNDIGIGYLATEKESNTSIKLITEIYNRTTEDETMTIKFTITGPTTQTKSQTITIKGRPSSNKGLPEPNIDATIETLTQTFTGLGEGYFVSDVNITGREVIGIEENPDNDNISSWFQFTGDTGGECVTPKDSTHLGDWLRSSNISSVIIDGKTFSETELLELVNFNALLMKDGYSQDLQVDADNYWRNYSFADTPTWYLGEEAFFGKGLWEYYSDTDRLNFKSKYGYVETNMFSLSTPGVYGAEFNIDFGDEWSLFDSDLKPRTTVSIVLNKLNNPVPNNPFYYLPFDGSVGLIEVDDSRQGYGLEYTGDKIVVSDAGKDNQVTTTGQPSSNPNNFLDSTYLKDFDQLNTFNRGKVLRVEGQTNSKMYYSPSFATPVVLEVVNAQDNAYAFYVLSVDNSPETSGQWLTKWTALFPQCLDFSGLPMLEAFSSQVDVQALSSNCAPAMGVQESVAYGLDWCSNNLSENGSVYLKTIFYTPQEAGTRQLELISENDHAKLFKTNSATGSKNISLEVPSKTINSVEEIFNKVLNQEICVSGDSASINFWWNPNNVYGENQSWENLSGNAIGCAETGNNKPPKYPPGKN
ncbi:MAG: carboxypeptidase-like regulatory domain-containing protein [archaeon]